MEPEAQRGMIAGVAGLGTPDMAKSILLAEDYEDDAILLRRSLQIAGVDACVVWVRDGDETIAYLKGDEPFSDRARFPLPSVVFLDLKMPRVNGFQVMEWLQQQPQFKGLLVVALSGDRELRDTSRAQALGAHSFLVKPCSPRDLRNLVKDFKESW